MIWFSHLSRKVEIFVSIKVKRFQVVPFLELHEEIEWLSSLSSHVNLRHYISRGLNFYLSCSIDEGLNQ
jgi:hypothetical protein